MSERDRELGALVRRAQAEDRLPSVAAAVVRGGEVVWSDAVGLADLEAERAATAETQYRIGSITKTFTAAAVFQLRDEGRLDLDDPVGRHVDELTVATPTIRSLLSHASGLQREQPGDMWETMVMPSQDELVASLGTAERVIPGSHWHYSNLAFSILGLVVERLRGVPYRQVVNERLLGPVGLARTTWTPVDPVAVAVPRRSLRRRRRASSRCSRTARSARPASCGARPSTSPRWGAFLGDPDPDVLSPAAAEEMRTVHAMAETDRWTLGWGAGLGSSGAASACGRGTAARCPASSPRCCSGRRSGSRSPWSRTRARAPTRTSSRSTWGRRSSSSRPEPPAEWRPSPPPEDVVPLLGVWWSEGHSFTFSWRSAAGSRRGST